MDADRFADLVEQVEQSGTPPEGEGDLLLTIASELLAMAPKTEISPEQEDRIFAKFLDLAPEAAPELAPELEQVAGVLTELAPAAAVQNLTDDVQDRIFAKIEQHLPELGTRRVSRLASAKHGLAAFTPRMLLQRKADALDTMISDARSGRKVHARGPMAELLTAAMSLQPAPAIEPSPSFADWLEVRMMSPANQIEQPKPGIGEVIRSGRFQTAMAGACAAIIALAAFNLGVSDPSLRKAPTSPDPAVARGETPPAGGQVASPDPASPLVPTIAAPTRTGPSGGSGSGGNNSGGNGGGGGGGNNNDDDGGGNQPAESDSVTQAAHTPSDALDRVTMFLNGETGGNP